MIQQPLIFISHDHRDIRLAREFSSLLWNASVKALPSFYASDRNGKGIPYGREWYETIMSSLRQTTAVVVLLTRRSIDRPWLAFEAGFAKGMGIHVFGVALGFPLKEANQGPFAHFQNCRGDETSLTSLIQQLIRDHHLETHSPHSKVRVAVKAFLARVQAGDGAEPQDEEPDLTARLFEEVKLIGRDLRKHDFAKIAGPGLFSEFPLVSGDGGYDATGLLLLLGVIREDLPGLYEIGLDLHRALSTRNVPAFQAARKQLLQSIRAITESDWLRSILAEKNRELAYRLYPLPDLLESYLRQLDPKE